MRRTLCLLIALALTAPVLATADKDDKDFVPLFDGKTLKGWKKAGGPAIYRVDGDCIVGEVPKGGMKPNAFLCTEKEYANFILRVEVKLDVPGNSGIQLRSHINDKGRVYGYQCEIDPSERAYSGGIYDEGRRGWLFDLKGKDKARKAFKAKEWNEFVIHAEGPHIRTWINGVPCADLLDAMDRSGFIALQVHSGKQGLIRWKNPRIKELPASKWQPLFDGKTLTGWKKLGAGEWTVEKGVLRGTATRDEKRHGILLTEKSYDDFAVKLQFKAIKGNSGLYFRVEEAPKSPVMVKGFQAEIDPKDDVGGLYETLGRGWVVRPKKQEAKPDKKDKKDKKGKKQEGYFKPGQWNEMTVIARGGRVVVQINGRKTAEVTDDPGRKSGPLGLQLHGGQDMDVQFRNIEVLERLAK